MPQAATPPAAPPAPQKAAKPEKVHVLSQKLRDEIESIEPDDRTSPERQFIRAQDLERDRAELMKRIAANREYLRLMGANDELSDDLADWLADFYPEKEKGEKRNADEVERTRLAKAAARNNTDDDDDDE